MPTPGAVLLDKPGDVTSFEALGPVKKCFGTKKVGHTGTLDRFATGLMVVMVGKATRLASLVTAQTKVYEFDLVFGVETDTLDPTGTVTREGRVPESEELQRVLPRFQGEIAQVPPAFSAVHVGGKRAYERVRAGEAPVLDARPVRIHELRLQRVDAELARMTVVCDKGTYVRSLARDIGASLGTVAHVRALRRSWIGRFSVDEGKRPEDLSGPGDLLAPVQLLERLDGVGIAQLESGRVERVRNGAPFQTSFLATSCPDEKTIALVAPDGDVVAVVDVDGERFKYRAVFS